MSECLANLSLDLLVKGKIPGTEENISHDLLVKHGQTLTPSQVADLERLLISDPENTSVLPMLVGAYVHFLEGHGSLPTEDSCFQFLVDGRIPGTEMEIPGGPHFRCPFTLTRPQVAALERLLQSYPDSFPLRSLLFDSYSMFRSSRTEDETNAYRDHYLWFMQNRPDEYVGYEVSRWNDPEGYGKARDLWIRLLNDPSRDYVAMFRNAFDFFRPNEPEIGEQIARKAQLLDPNNRPSAYKLCCICIGHMYSSKGAARKENATEALERFKIFRKFQSEDMDDTPDSDFYLGVVAIEAGDLDCARECVNKMLEYGDLEYRANTLMGLMAMSRGDVTAAREFLFKSLDAVKSNSRETDNPEYALAEKLYACGEVADVLTYLRAFDYEFDKELVEQIERGLEPDWTDMWGYW